MKEFIFDFYDAIKKFKIWISLSKFDIIKRYKRSLIGPWWITLSTFFLILGISLLYSIILNQDFKTHIFNLSINLIIWIFIRESIVDSCQSLIESKNLIMNEQFNIIVFALRVILRNLIIFAHNTLIIFLLLLFLKDKFELYGVLLFFLNLFLLVLFLIPICISVSLISTRFRDFQMIVTNIMQLLFFISPILFTKQLVSNVEWIININPFAMLMLLISESLTENKINLDYFFYIIFYFLFFYFFNLKIYSYYKKKITYWL